MGAIAFLHWMQGSSFASRRRPSISDRRSAFLAKSWPEAAAMIAFNSSGVAT